MSSSRLDRIAANKQRAEAFFQHVVDQGVLYTWGSDEGITPWEDRLGDTLLPLWPDEASAFAENQDDVEPGEKVLERRLEELPSSLRRWMDADVGIAVHPVGGNIVGTYRVPEFAARLLKAAKADEREPTAWMTELAKLVRVLP